jgi:DNA-binding FadR family transcriptional regulator
METDVTCARGMLRSCHEYFLTRNTCPNQSARPQQLEPLYSRRSLVAGAPNWSSRGSPTRSNWGSCRTASDFRASRRWRGDSALLQSLLERALEALREKGLVETKRGRDGGSFVLSDGSRAASIDRRVKALSRVELRDMGVYYSAIAAMAAQLAADRATEDDILHLRATIDAVDVASEASTRRGEGTFRLEIAALSQSARLVREELRLQAEFAPLLWLCLRDSDHRERSREAHACVVESIESLDGESARKHTIDHIAGAIEWLLEAKADLEGKE